MTTIAAALFLFLFSTFAVAESIELVTGNGYPPFADENLPNGGLATEVVTVVLENMGYEPIITFKPWKRGFIETKDIKYIGTFPYGKNEQRTKDFLYSDPLYNLAQFFFVNHDSGIKFSRDEDLQGLRVCIPIGYNPTRVQDMVDKGIVTLERPEDIDACFNMLKLGRVDQVRVDEYVGWAVVEKLFDSRSGFRKLANPVRENIEHFIVSKAYVNGRSLIDDFNRSLGELRRKGVLEGIMRVHLKF